MGPTSFHVSLVINLSFIFLVRFREVGERERERGGDGGVWRPIRGGFDWNLIFCWRWRMTGATQLRLAGKISGFRFLLFLSPKFCLSRSISFNNCFSLEFFRVVEVESYCILQGLGFYFLSRNLYLTWWNDFNPWTFLPQELEFVQVLIYLLLPNKVYRQNNAGCSLKNYLLTTCLEIGRRALQKRGISDGVFSPYEREGKHSW